MTEIKAEKHNQVAPASVKGRWNFRFVGPVPASGDRDTTERAFNYLDRAALNPDLAMNGIAAGQGLEILEGVSESWMAKSDPSQPVSVLENFGDTIVHTRELIREPRGREKMREFIVSIVSKYDVSGVPGLAEIMKRRPTENKEGKVIQFSQRNELRPTG